MAPPPATPTPHRFLVPKRSASQRHNTPRPPPTGSQQFHATPRFSLRSTPGASLPSSTPVPPTAFVRHRNTERIIDDLDSSPPVPQPANPQYDAIEADSTPSSAAVPTSEDDEPLGDGKAEKGEPSPKRRRLSSSSILDLDLDTAMLETTTDQQEQGMDEHGKSESEAPESSKPDTIQQPMFQRAPRFKPVEQQVASRHEPLPEAFSPRRRGTKYMPNGLAAEMRDWLMDIEANTGPKRDDDFAAKIIVGEVRRGPNLTLIKGRRPLDDSIANSHASCNPTMNVMLAGEGRLIGLARRNDVAVGSLIGLAEPIWDVNIGIEGHWAVACDWIVL